MEQLNMFLITIGILLIPFVDMFLISNKSKKHTNNIPFNIKIQELEKENARLKRELQNYIYESTNSIMKELQTSKMIKINIHGFSVNKMYEANPYYNPTKVGSCKLRCTNDYREWAIKTLGIMRTSHLKSLKEMNVNPNNKMKIELCFGTKANYDADNLAKSFIDTIVKFYNLPNDNNFYEINIKKEIVSDYKNGYIKYAISNL